MPPAEANDPLRTTDYEASPRPVGPDVTPDVASCAHSYHAVTATHVPNWATGPAGTERAHASISVPGYEIEAVLGRGGMGVVYKARHLALKRTVALKMVLAGGHAGPRELARFRIEAEAAARLQHPNIVQIHEVSEADGHPYCALEFVEGGNLAKKIAGQPLPARVAARLVETLARAMQLAHSRNVVHRDLKPANILLSFSGGSQNRPSADQALSDAIPKITDFGLARQLDSDSGETQAGAVMGTPSYMAPEQASGRAHEAGPAADIYALGAILYECLTGRPPFLGQTVVETLDQVRTQEPVPPSRRQAGVPPDLDTICLKCLRKEPEKRYASAAELADELLRYQQGEPILARPVGRLERAVKWVRRNPVVALAGAAAVLALVAGLGGTTWGLLDATAAKEKETQARTKAEQKEAEAQLQRIKAQDAEEAGRKLLYTTDMRLAPFVWRDDHATAAQLRELLASHIPNNLTPNQADLRGFEWYYYQHLLDRSAAVFSGHETSVIDSAFTSDGQLVTLDQNAQVRRWDLASQHEDQASRRDLAKVGSAAIQVLSPDGRLAALAEGNKVYVVDTSTGKQRFQIDSAPATDRRLLFTRDSTSLVIVDDTIRWCAAGGGQVIASFAQGFDRGPILSLSADGLTLAVVGGWQASIYRLDQTTRTVSRQSAPVTADGALNAAALSPDGRLIALGHFFAGGVVVCDTRTGRPIADLGHAHTCAVSAMTFSSDGFRLVTADIKGTIKIWEDARNLTSTSAATRTLKGHEAAITHVGFSSARQQLVSTSGDKTVRVWDMEHPSAAFRVLEQSHPSWMARFSPDGLLIAMEGGRSVQLWDAATGKIVRELPAGDRLRGRICSVAFSPTDQRLLAAGYGGEADVSHVVLWDIDAGTELARLPGATDLPDFNLNESTGMVGALAFSPDGKYLVAGFGSHFGFQNGSPPLKVWEVAKRRLVRRLSGHTGYCAALDFSRDGTRLASASRDGTAMIWSTESWQATQTLQNPDLSTLGGPAGQRGSVEDVAFTPDGRTLVMASREGSVLLWDVATGRLQETLKGHSGTVMSAAMSPDGRTLATGGSDRMVRLWNVESRRELMQLDVRFGYAESLAFSPDGKELLASGGNIRGLWSTAPMVWNDPVRAAEKLRLLLRSNADFASRIRMFSENLRIHEALEKLDSNEVQVQAALAATRANWHGAHQRWAEAVQEYDRLERLRPGEPQSWLQTPGLIRVATALFRQGRPALAAKLRRQALGWLQAEWATLGRLLESAPREDIVQTLNSWRKDADLAGIRDAAALAKLPAAEAKEWQALWAEIDTALRFRLPKTGPHSWMAQDREGKLLAVPNGDAVALFDAQTGESVRTLTGDGHRLYAVAFSPDGKFLAGTSWSGGGDKPRTGSIQVWDLKTGEATATLASGLGWTWSLAFSPDGKQLLASGDMGLEVWDLSTRKAVRSFAGGAVWQLGLGPDGKKVACCDPDAKTVRVFNHVNGEHLGTLEGFAEVVRATAFAPDGKLLATGSDTELLLWDADKLALVKKIDTPAGWVAFEPGGKTLLTASHDQNGPKQNHIVTRWDLATFEGKPFPPLSGRAGWNVFHLSPDGKTLYSLAVDADRRVWVHDLLAPSKR